MAASVLAYLGACDVVRMLTHQELVGAPPAYLLVPTVSEAELAAAAMPNGNGRNGHKPQPVANGTAVSDPTKPAANGNGRANAQPSVDLMYGDGTAVDATTVEGSIVGLLSGADGVGSGKLALMALVPLP
jgi:hypothetical protein